MQLQARIVVMEESSNKPFYYTKEHNEIKSIIDFSPDSVGDWSVKAGETINIKGVEYTIENVEMRVYQKTNLPDGYGTNLYRAGEDHAFNIDIILLVTD